MAKKILTALNIFNRCDRYNVKTVWQCPEFLFFVFGIIIIAAIFLTNSLAIRYAGPELAALLALAVTVPLMIIAYSVVKSFEYLSLSSQIKTEFIKIMTNRLKNPLAAIREQINSYSSKLEDPERLAFINTIKMESEEMFKTINKFLTLKNIEEDNFDLNKTEFFIYDLIYDISNPARAQQVNVVIKKEEENPKVLADKEKIKIVLENLLDNAVKHGGADKNTPVEIVIEKQNNKVKITVSDKGGGINKEQRKNIFEKSPTYLADENNKTQGLGLGLYLSKKIIKAHKEEIGFDDKKSKGANFWFTLPLR